eukprot:TRINITY_DN29210_c0_g1_i2.p1 TRINITY_DN29210_c0_g1~~TRINITY_DN29210_c0_g1_i2.p1  ORF type:complete len:275 (+),score=44.98 TRINITY_DN29210_c0_g1_i2:75-899(+)
MRDCTLEDCVASTSGIKEKLEEFGVAIVRDVLSAEQSRAALEAILQHHAESADTPAWFSQRCPQRDDMLLRHNLPHMQEALTKTLELLAEPLMGMLGEDAVCAELAAHISMPGAKAQEFHRDHSWTQNCQVVTCFAALQDIAHDFGPTEVYLGSHAIEEFGSEEIRATGAEILQLQLRRGDVALMDTRLVHRGGMRSSSPREGRPVHRVLLYTTWREGCARFGDDFCPSILPEYEDRLPLCRWDTWIQSGPMETSLPYRMALWQARERGEQGGG